MELCQLVKRLQTHSHSKYLKKNHHLHLVVLSFLLFYKSFKIHDQVDYASSELHDSTQRKEIFLPTKTYCSFNKDFAGLLILMQCINKLYLLVMWQMASTLGVVDSGWMQQGHHYIAYTVMISYLALRMASLIASCMGPTWGPSRADRTQVGPMLAPWTLLSGLTSQHVNTLRLRQNVKHFALTFSNLFSWMKVDGFLLIFHLSSFLIVQLTIFDHWFR